MWTDPISHFIDDQNNYIQFYEIINFMFLRDGHWDLEYYCISFSYNIVDYTI